MTGIAFIYLATVFLAWVGALFWAAKKIWNTVKQAKAGQVSILGKTVTQSENLFRFIAVVVLHIVTALLIFGASTILAAIALISFGASGV